MSLEESIAHHVSEPSPARGRATVIGAGVIGLTSALALARDGWTVTIVAQEAASASVSSVAGGIWFPYKAEASERAQRLLDDSFREFVRLATQVPESGVDLRSGTWVERLPGTDRSWAAAVPGVRRAPEDEVPLGALDALRAELPIVDMPTFLHWLEDECQAEGIIPLQSKVRSPRDAAELTGADLVVVAAGAGSGPLLGDFTGFPVRGQVVRLQQPGITHWLIDDDHPDGMIYVIPRRGDIVIGGTADDGEFDTEVNPELETALLARAVAAVPELAGLRVLSSAVGLRPARPTLRLERFESHGVPVVAAYGHGGAGVTLSWGTAAEVARLARGE